MEESWGVAGQLELLVSTMAIKLGLAKFAPEQTLLVLVYNNKPHLLIFLGYCLKQSSLGWLLFYLRFWLEFCMLKMSEGCEC
jgi:hypothetical protein